MIGIPFDGHARSVEYNRHRIGGDFHGNGKNTDDNDSKEDGFVFGKITHGSIELRGRLFRFYLDGFVQLQLQQQWFDFLKNSIG